MLLLKGFSIPWFGFFLQGMVEDNAKGFLRSNHFNPNMKGVSVFASALILITAGIYFNGRVDGYEDVAVRTVVDSYATASIPLMVDLTLIRQPAFKEAVCLDGSLPGYHMDRGNGNGSWLIFLEGGGWCNSVTSCIYRMSTARGSSFHMEKKLPFTGILSNNHEENPLFYNWNRVKIRYCDGASFTGNTSVQSASKQLEFRGQLIWLSVMSELMQIGMQHAKQALLSGCSAGGLASIIHCDEFRSLLPKRTRVKCLSDAGFFLDAVDVSGGRSLKNMFDGVVKLHGVKYSLPRSCTNRMDATMCFFPQNLVGSIKTPLFLVNAAYDSWQIQMSLAPAKADPRGSWSRCRGNMNSSACSNDQINFLQRFRIEMLSAMGGFLKQKKNGVFLNSCFAHCQTELQDTWFGIRSPSINHSRIAEAVGDWYFNRRPGVAAVDCPYPCDLTCHNMVFP